MFYSARSKLILSFFCMVVIVCGAALVVGSRLLYRGFLKEATDRVSQDLNAAREVYLTYTNGVKIALDLTSTEPAFHSALKRHDFASLLTRIRGVAQQGKLDFMGIVGEDGKIICRIGPNPTPGEDDPPNPLADFVLHNQIGISGTAILDTHFLFNEDPKLAERVRIPLLAPKMAMPKIQGGELSGMALAAAVPVREARNIIGVLYAGVLLNHDQEIVARIHSTVFQNEAYDGRSIGDITIFFENIGISTSSLNPDGGLALGTVAPEQVTQRVLMEGRRWTNRVFVANDWQIVSYDPIQDVFGQKIGMLSVGVHEGKYGGKYGDERSSVIKTFVLITVAGMALALVFGYIIADRLSRPIKKLIEASKQVSQGNLSPEIGPISKTEIGILQKTFKEMLASLRQRSERQKVESEMKLLQFEKEANIGRLAGGVAHEINNPLTGIITFTHMLLRNQDLSADVRSDLETIAQATERVRKIVKGLLDFSRQAELDREPTDVNDLVARTISIVENQALIKGVILRFERGEGLPLITLDKNQMQSVLLNILLNALDATDSGGYITITAGIGMSTDKSSQRGIEIVCMDTGCGIAPENLDKIFEPFFTTKDVGQGTGLGLSVSSGIVERHGGTIRVLSQVGRGSTFIIWLPIEEQNTGEDTGR